MYILANKKEAGIGRERREEKRRERERRFQVLQQG
jgi:hypothetical protein